MSVSPVSHNVKAVNETISPQGPFSSCSGAFSYITSSVSAGELKVCNIFTFILPIDRLSDLMLQLYSVC